MTTGYEICDREPTGSGPGGEACEEEEVLIGSIVVLCDRSWSNFGGFVFNGPLTQEL